MKIHKSVFVAKGAFILGDVQIGEQSSVWYNAVIRGDELPISVGKFSNIQDNCTIHTETKPVRIGDYVTLGHNAVVHGAEIADNCLIGINAVILDGAKIGKNSLVGAGAVVTEGTTIPAGSLVLGVPAKVVRKLDRKEIEFIKKNAINYIELAKKHKDGYYDKKRTA
jgi:carbonic anhydrase/acetyltransferase-like protein (isoleucine patch superfamily)